jgi:hypothetical protein
VSISLILLLVVTGKFATSASCFWPYRSGSVDGSQQYHEGEHGRVLAGDAAFGKFEPLPKFGRESILEAFPISFFNRKDRAVGTRKAVNPRQQQSDAALADICWLCTVFNRDVT